MRGRMYWYVTDGDVGAMKESIRKRRRHEGHSETSVT